MSASAFCKLGSITAGPVFHREIMFSLSYERSKLHYWSFVNSSVCSRFCGLNRNIRLFSGVSVYANKLKFPRLSLYLTILTNDFCSSAVIPYTQNWSFLTKLIPDKIIINQSLSNEIWKFHKFFCTW